MRLRGAAISESMKTVYRIADDYADACQALSEAQAFYDRNAESMDDGPRATALAALATARFARVTAASSMLQTAGSAALR
jgi:hypothetical protein